MHAIWKYTCTNALHHPSGLCKCHPVWTAKIPSRKIKPSRTCVQNSSQTGASTKGLSLALKKLHWLPIEQRTECKILTSTFKCITGTAPKYLEDLTKTKKNRRDNMHSNSNGITLQRPKVKYKTFATRSFKYSAPPLWNQLPKTIREFPNLDNIKKKLKTHLFQQAFNLN